MLRLPTLAFIFIAGECIMGTASAQDAPGDYVVSVTPDGNTVVQALQTRDTVQFTVSNDGTLADTYTFTCSVTGGLACVAVSPTSATIQPDLFKKVTVIYDVGASAGSVRLTATGNATDLGWFAITSEPTITIVAPVLTSGSRAVVRNRQPLLRATFLPNGSGIDTTATVLTWKRGATTDTVSGLARANRGLLEWEVDSTYWIAVGDSGLLTVRVCALNGLCATATRWAVLPNDNKPVLGFTGMPLEALGRQFGAPFGPGLAVSGAEVETGFSIPAYVSMGAARSTGLVYSTRQSYPRALVPVDVELTWPAGTPDQLNVILWDGAVRLDSLVLTSPTCATGSARRCRAVLQGDFAGSSFSSPTRKWLTVEIRVTSGAATNIATDSVEVVLVDRRSTRYGAGWWPSGVLQLAAAGSDRVLVGASGAAAIYRGNGDSVYLSPPGDFSVLKKVSGGWELSPRGSLAMLVFDTNGRLVRAVDANGNKDSVVYNGTSDQVTSLRDPVGKTITFGYDGNGKLATFTDPAGRQTRVTINGTTNQLTYDSLPSATARPYATTFVYQSYPGTNTVLLTRRIGVIADTTVVTYDSTFKRRPSQVTVPEVQDENGSAVKPVIAYTPAERQGFGALRTLDSVYVQLTDPRGNWTRSLLNRWGQARRTWDALGLLGRVEYTGEGFVLWAEGKNGDSSRVHSRYDALRRLVRTYIVRSATDTLKLDSLVYDGNHRVIARIDARGKRDSVVYDAQGNVLRTITPHNDTTKFWYRSDGLLDSTRAPGNTVSRRFSYDATWKNPLRVVDEAGITVDSAIVDALGRDSIHLSKVRVQVTTTTSKWQWRRVETFFNVTGQADSTRLSRTDDCNDPCATPPAWPAANDTLRTQRVGHRFDRAGRDSLRVNDRGKATLYLYDRLGRLVSRRPWTDSMAVKDSIVYDIAGNVKRTITRRGDVITSSYDFRNRDTLTVIPGVGDLRRAFAGPLDQVTRLWFDNLVDSIGGVNPALAWVYDQRGRLTADTSFTGPTPRAASYTYDGFERPSATTDVLGTWTLRYETDRGYADTLITPFADTVTYSFDARDRAVGPYVSSGTQHARVPTWNATGALRTLTNSVTTAPTYVTGKWDRKVFPDDPLAALGPVWTEQHGAGAGVDSLQDSLTFDGWERLTAWVGFKNGIAAARDTFRFDRVGNIQTTAGAEVYDVTTGRLTARTDGGGTWSYTYDRAGNLVQAVQSGVTWTYGYDVLNRLRSVRQNGTLISRYAYDVSGRRIAKRVYSTATGGTLGYTRFVYRGANVGFETDSSGAIDLRYVWGPAADDLLAIRDSVGSSSVTYYVVQDKLRSVRGLERRDGTWIMSRRFGPYGAIIADTVNGTLPFELRYRWTTREYDPETGWYYFRARYYDLAARRFVAEDPIGYAGGMNPYAYVDGNPVDARDPSGLITNNELLYAEGVRSSCEMGFYVDGASLGCGGARGSIGEFMMGELAEYNRNLILGNMQFDQLMQGLAKAVSCSKGNCPTVQDLLKDAVFMGNLRRLFGLSQRLGKEVGAYFLRAQDGSVTLGASGIGDPGHFDFGILGPLPANAFIEFHTHHDIPRGGGAPGGPPNSSDWPSVGSIYSVVMNRNYIWFLTLWQPPGQVYRWH